MLIGAFSATLGLCSVVLLAVFGAVLAEVLYNATHAIPNPFERGEDIGTAFAALLGFVVGAAVSVPLSFAVYRLASTRLVNQFAAE